MLSIYLLKIVTKKIIWSWISVFLSCTYFWFYRNSSVVTMQPFSEMWDLQVWPYRQIWSSSSSSSSLSYSPTASSLHWHVLPYWVLIAEHNSSIIIILRWKLTDLHSPSSEWTQNHNTSGGSGLLLMKSIRLLLWPSAWAILILLRPNIRLN